MAPWTTKELNRQFLPRRPQRALSGFNIFVKEFFERNKYHNGREGIQAAAQEWRRKSESEKNMYVRLAAKLKGNHAKEMKIWYRKKAVLKRPRNVYMQFVKDNSKERKGRTLRQFNLIVMRKWSLMSKEQKGYYKEDYIDRWEAYNDMVEDLTVEVTTIDDYIDGDDEDSSDSNEE